MIDSNNINVMREKLRKITSTEGIKNAVESISHLIGASAIPSPSKTITGCLNNHDGRIVALENGGGGGTEWTPLNIVGGQSLPDLSSFNELMIVMGTHHTGGGVCFSNVFKASEIALLPNANSNEKFVVGGYYKSSSDNASAIANIRHIDAGYIFDSVNLYINGSSVTYGQLRLFTR